MKRSKFGIVLRIFVLTGVFFVVINYFGYFLNADETENIEISENKENFKSEDIYVMGNVGVAITTNVGTRYKQTDETPVTVYKDVIEIGYILGNQSVAKDKIISENMLYLNEYLNILKTDIKSLLANSSDREFALDSFVAQLEYRYKAGLENMSNLNIQKEDLLSYYESSLSEIENVKDEISLDFSQFNDEDTIDNIDSYLKISEEKLNARTYIVFINKFLSYYQTLNNYNKKVLDTLINNKEILIKNTQVVIPDSGGDLLKQLKILYTEDEWEDEQ